MEPGASDDIALAIGLASQNAIVAHAFEVDGNVSTVHDELGEGIAGGRALLQAMAREAVGEIEIRDSGMAGRSRAFWSSAL